MINVEHIEKSYQIPYQHKQKPVLFDVNLSLAEGEILGLMGPSGCGKSTLARIILGIIKPTSGKVIYQGIDLTVLNNKKLKPFRQKIQFISQRPESHFDPSIKIGKSLIEPLYNFHISIPEKKDEISRLLEELKLREELLERYPHQVSGGEIQRLSLLRALLLDPQVLVLDEPTSMLDISVQAQIITVLQELQQKRNLTYLFISHDEQVVKHFSHRILQMKDGKIFYP